MTREQAINYLFSCGFTNEQVGEVVRALTYEPTTKNDSSELEKNSKKLEKDFGELDCIDRAELLKAIDTWDKFGCDADTKLVPYQDHYIPYIHYDDVIKCIKGLPSVTPQLSVPEVTALAEWIEKLTKASEDAYNKGYADGMKAQQERKINAEKAIEILKADNIAGYSVEDILNARDMAIKAIKQESRKGHWINTANPRMSDNIVCSECGYDSIADFKFCPCCGADMREVKE